jgi:sulfate adenylyltransferase
MSGLIVPHGKEEKLIPSLLEGSELPAELSRPEVVKILQKYYQGLEEKVEIKLHGAATGDVTKK